MLEILGGAAAPEDVHDRVEPDESHDFLRFLLDYARRLRGQEQAMVRDMALPYLPAMIPLITKGDAESRGFAVKILANMGMPRYADEVANALDDRSPVVAMIAARSLFRPGHERHFPHVLSHLRRFAHWSRSFLAGLLAGGGPHAAPLLREVMASRSEQPIVRAIAGDALCELNDLAAVDVAMRVLDAETDRDLVASALRILRKLGHEEHLPVVRELVASLDPVVRATAAATLGSIGTVDDIPLLQDRLDDPYFWASLEAARGLLALGEAATLQRLADSEGHWSTLAQQVLSE